MKKDKYLKYITILLPVVTCFVLAGCGKLNLYNVKKGEVLASVDDKELYTADIQNFFTPDMTAGDSLTVIESVRLPWIRTQLKLKAAGIALSDDQSDIDAMVDEYRTSLMIQKYETNYVDQKLDTNITDQQIKEYYDENRNNFRLAGPIVKARIARIPARNGSQNKKLEDLFKSSRQEDTDDFMNISDKNNYRTYDFTTSWIDFNSLLQYIPFSQTNIDEFLNSKKYYEVEDDQYKYLMKIESFRPTGDYSPEENETENIRKILLNRRRFELLQQLEDSLYNTAARNQTIKIK